VVLRAVDSFPRVTGLAAYRIVQESLTNAMKHAPGQPIRLSVRSAAHEGVRLRIVNTLPEAVGGERQQRNAR
ncbi:sensor histidine kinase, partial [Brevibacterium paucivorans]